MPGRVSWKLVRPLKRFLSSSRILLSLDAHAVLDARTQLRRQRKMAVGIPALTTAIPSSSSTAALDHHESVSATRTATIVCIIVPVVLVVTGIVAGVLLCVRSRKRRALKSSWIEEGALAARSPPSLSMICPS